MVAEKYLSKYFTLILVFFTLLFCPNILFGQVCSYSISPASLSFYKNGGTGSVGVTAASGCSWTASSNADWITITGGSSGSGNGTVSYSVSANTYASNRSGTMTIAGQTFTVTQSACSTILSPEYESFNSGSNVGEVYVSAQTDCGWSALSNATWITITAGRAGTGGGKVTYSVSANTDIARSGTLTIGDRTFTVNLAAREVWA
jgi:hypothetical protein